MLLMSVSDDKFRSWVADEKELLDREPTETFVVQAEIYIDDRDEDLLELREMNYAAIRLAAEEEEVKKPKGSELESESGPEKHETHLAAIYEEVADLRSQAGDPCFLQPWN